MNMEIGLDDIANVAAERVREESRQEVDRRFRTMLGLYSAVLAALSLGFGILLVVLGYAGYKFSEDIISRLTESELAEINNKIIMLQLVQQANTLEDSFDTISNPDDIDKLGALAMTSLRNVSSADRTTASGEAGSGSLVDDPFFPVALERLIDVFLKNDATRVLVYEIEDLFPEATLQSYGMLWSLQYFYMEEFARFVDARRELRGARRDRYQEITARFESFNYPERTLVGRLLLDFLETKTATSYGAELVAEMDTNVNSEASVVAATLDLMCDGGGFLMADESRLDDVAFEMLQAYPRLTEDYGDYFEMCPVEWTNP